MGRGSHGYVTVAVCLDLSMCTFQLSTTTGVTSMSSALWNTSVLALTLACCCLSTRGVNGYSHDLLNYTRPPWLSQTPEYTRYGSCLVVSSSPVLQSSSRDQA